MKTTSRPRRWLKRIISIALIVELSWVVLINAALQLPLTQDLINKIRPEKFRLSWDKAWTWYPARVHVVGAFANGQSRSQQWQFAADSVAGSINLLPLLFKRVWVSDVVVSNIEYRQRPRLQPDKDYADIMPYFPDIEGWAMTDAVTTPRKRRSWRVAVEGIHARGQHSYWIMNLQGTGAGEINADLSYDTRERLFALDADELTLDLDPLYINGDQEMFRRGTLQGSLGFLPFVPSEHKDASMLNFLLLDAEMVFDVNSLAFINLFTLDFGNLTVDGSGRVDGRLRLDQGVLLTGTDLSVDADDLRVRLLDHSIAGTGQVALRLGPETANQLDLVFHYRDLEVTHDEEPRPTLTGQSLDLTIGGDGRLLRNPEQINQSRSITLAINRLAVTDLAAFQRYLPDKWPIRLHGGQGFLHGTARLTPNALEVDLGLDSNSADMGFQAYRFTTNLDTALKLHNPSIMSTSTDIGGSFIRLSESVLEHDGLEDVRPWGASLEIEEGYFSLIDEVDRQDQDHLIDLFALLAEAESRQLLSDSSAQLEFHADVSSLAWIAVLLGGQYDTDVSGSSAIKGSLQLEAGLPAVGTNIDIQSQDLAVKFLDYVSRGDGAISFRVEQGGANPDWLVAIELDNAATNRQGEPEPFLHDVALTVNAIVEDMDFDRQHRQFSIALKILEAQVTDMSTFNSLLPPDSPLRFTSGTADLAADIVLQHDDADGWLKLRSSGLSAQADTHSVTADLAADLLLVDGVPADRIFDLTGSVIDLSHVRVAGETEQFDQEHWSATLVLTRGDAVLTDPPRMDLEAQLHMSDSRPIVAMFQNQEGWRPDFLARMITIEDIEGTARVAMANERVVIPHAHAISDNIEVEAKGVITAESRNGVVYMRYKKADALLKINNGKKNLDIFRVRESFEDYRVPPP